jgi:hypothetical protein
MMKRSPGWFRSADGWAAVAQKGLHSPAHRSCRPQDSTIARQAGRRGAVALMYVFSCERRRAIVTSVASLGCLHRVRSTKSALCQQRPARMVWWEWESADSRRPGVARQTLMMLKRESKHRRQPLPCLPSSSSRPQSE